VRTIAIAFAALALGVIAATQVYIVTQPDQDALATCEAAASNLGAQLEAAQRIIEGHAQIVGDMGEIVEESGYKRTGYVAAQMLRDDTHVRRTAEALDRCERVYG
jgi:hypothetical protein